MKRLLFVLFISGLAVSSESEAGGLRFIPSETIDAATAPRLECVYSHEFESYFFERLILAPDMPSALGTAEVDSSTHRMYLQRRIWLGLRYGQPAGLYTLDLRNNRELHRTRFPENEDLTGEVHYATSSCIYMLARRAALFQFRNLMLLDLEQDRPALVEHEKYPVDIGVSAHPDVDDRRFLLVREQMDSRPFGPSHLLYLDVDKRQITAKLSLESLGRPFSHGNSIRGGVKEYVLARRDENLEFGAELLVLDTSGGTVKPYSRVRLEDGWHPALDEIDWVHGWWVVSEKGPDTQGRVRVYAVPSLDILAELPGPAEELSVCSGTGVLSLIRQRTPRHLILYQLPQGAEFAQIRLPDTDYAGTWDAVKDARGVYVGVSGCQRVHLWAVRPASKSSRGAQ